jgi:uncharacterized membrane protein YkoI
MLSLQVQGISVASIFYHASKSVQYANFFAAGTRQGDILTLEELAVKGRMKLAVLVLLAGLVFVRADMSKVPLDQLPKPILDAIKAKYPGAKLLGAGQEMREGKTLYAVSIDTKGQKTQVTLRPDGTLVATAKEIAVRDLPAAVERTVRSRYPREALSKAAQEIRGDKTVYAVLLDTGTGTPYEVVLDPQGKILREGWRSGE